MMANKKSNASHWIIGLDFDGTCVTHDFPLVGQDIGAVPVLKKLIAKGHRIVLYTMRSDGPNGYFLTDAVNWFRENGIPLFGVNENPEHKAWTSSPKPYAHIYIDDAALGVPLRRRRGKSLERDFVNWEKVEQLLVKEGLL